ncbi:hypothetical protein F5B21DRAFT_516354 [Xylaria acuta]|nr:hypothetical protein F5B21DRAFT_516354 [Xylaria acuta]
MLSFVKNQSVIEGPVDFPPVDQVWYAIATDADEPHMAAQRIEDIFEIVRCLIQGDRRDTIVLRLKQTNSTATENACESSVDLAFRLLLMLKVGVVRHQASLRHHLKWEKDSLKDFVRDRFNESPALDCHHVRLPKSFNAWSISTIGGLKLGFTDNLADNLLPIDDDTTVLIFHHASFLEYRVKLVVTLSTTDATVLTSIALFIRMSEFRSLIRNNNNKRVWFQKLCSASGPCPVDHQVALCGNLRAEERQIERFAFWRDRSIILKQIYDDATPMTIKQWWHDRRNGERWFAFWVAVLVLMITMTLGLVQYIESALQAYKAYITQLSSKRGSYCSL